jgi:acetoacetyl-CoA synthetase
MKKQPVHSIQCALDKTSQQALQRPHIPLRNGTPESTSVSQMTAFTTALEACTGEVFPDYQALHDFSVREYRTFWHCFLHWPPARLDFFGSAVPVCEGEDCEHARFFPQVRLNYADNLLNLSVASKDAPALTACHADGRRVRLTRGELRERVARLAQALSALGLSEGDRVVGVMRNDAQAVIAALAVTALGATLSTAVPEMGVEAIVDRFAPLAPRLLLAHSAVQLFDTGRSLADNVADLAAALPSLQTVVRLDDGILPATIKLPVHALDELMRGGDAGRFVWQRFPFNHPLFIMFSSGTTGKPKCIVHGAGGSLLEHLKEHRLHTDLRPGDRMYFHTNCAWMMWNWQLSALASGVEIVTSDGPISAIDTLWRLVADERVTVFGTSPAYLRMCQDAGLVPGREFDLSALRAILSTGAVLYDAQFDWVREHVKRLPLQSISGGTDILGCFVLGNPNLPVYAGEAQCKSLGFDVQAWEQGARTSGVGQLVCANPFPSRPLGFFGDPNGVAFHVAYFTQNPGVWTHGDLIEFSPEGAARLHGRIDGVLIVRGINVAPGEIYRVLNDIPDIRESMVVEQRSGGCVPGQQPGTSLEQRIVLLLTLRGGTVLTGALVRRVRRELANRLSAAHVPDRIIAVDELPVTHNGKLSEAAARRAVNGLGVDNATALRNPECLEAIRNHPALQPQADALPVTGALREQLEQLLRARWERLFAFAPIALDENFFELGGNSLLAARLLADVRPAVGRALPLSTLLVAPTIRRLAALIEDDTQLPSAPMPVLLRAGNGPPLFLVHGVSGSVMECWTLVGALKSQRPVYGLQAQGLDGEQFPQQQVEIIAASYIVQMRRVQGSGPYAVAGYSFGGLVALEIAQQLLRTGETIELLCLLDTYVSQNLSWSAWTKYRFARAVRKLGVLPASQFLPYLTGKLAVAAGRAPIRVTPMPGQPAGSPLRIVSAPQQQVLEKMTAAMDAYRPQPYHGGPIVYVRAAVTQGQYYDPMPLWQRLANGGLKIVEVPDGHLDMLGPNAQLVAAAIDRALMNA